MPEAMSRIWTLNPESWMLVVRHLRVTPRMRGLESSICTEWD